MTLDEILGKYGSQRAAGHAIGYSQQSVSKWVKKGHIPFKAQVAIERFTKGLFRAESFSATRRRINGHRA